MALLLLALQVLAASGCTTWARVPSNGLPDPAPQQVQVWSSGSATLVQEPAVRGDSLVGTIAPAKPGDAELPMARPMAEVDSLRVHKVSVSRTALAGVVLGASLFFVFTISGGFYSPGY